MFDLIKPIYNKDGIVLYHGDSMEILSFFHLNQVYYREVDLLLTDPPFGIDYSSLRGKKSIKNDDFESTKNLADNFLKDVRFLFRPGASYYLFTGNHGPGPRIWETILEGDNTNKHYSTGIRPIQSLVWDKCNFGTGHFFRYQWERILFGCFGERPRTWNGNSDHADVLRYPRVAGTKITHPNEKPIPLINDLIRFSSNKGDLILEPFGGSGVVAAACLHLGRRCVSIELDDQHIETQIKRLENTNNHQVALF